MATENLRQLLRSRRGESTTFTFGPVPEDIGLKLERTNNPHNASSKGLA
jgi:hypothetical protein